MSAARHQRTSPTQLRSGKHTKSLIKAGKGPKALTFRTKPSPPSPPETPIPPVPRSSPSPTPEGIFCPEERCKRHHAAEELKPFTNQKALKNHQKNAHTAKEDRKHHCKYIEPGEDKECGEHFVYKKDLDRHVRNIHTKDHPQWCLVEGCHLFEHGQPVFNLRRHYKVHNMEQWDACKSMFGLDGVAKAVASAVVAV